MLTSQSIFSGSWNKFSRGRQRFFPTLCTRRCSVQRGTTNRKWCQSYLPIFESFLLHGIKVVKKISGQTLCLSYPGPFVLMLNSGVIHRHELWRLEQVFMVERSQKQRRTNHVHLRRRILDVPVDQPCGGQVISASPAMNKQVFTLTPPGRECPSWCTQGY